MAKLEGLCSPTEAYLFYVGWSKVYERMQGFFTSPQMREAGLDLAEINTPLKVLDVGAGTGTLSMQVGARCGFDQLTLIDQSPHMLNQAKAKPQLADCEAILADCTQELPFDDDSFDRVVSSGVFYYFPNPVESLREQLRVCRPGGRVLVMGSLEPPSRFIRLLAQTFNRFPSIQQYVGWFEEAGLNNIQYKLVTNPWNATQYAIAICGTKTPGTVPVRRAQPAPPGLVFGLLHRAIALPLALVRFGVALAAFSLLGPMPICNAALGKRRLRVEQHKVKGP
jgi:MPBQ/MSBQ methyltransferase